MGDVQQSVPEPPTPRCALCAHPKKDHDGHADHRARFSPLVAGDPWCHACNATCDYTKPGGDAGKWTAPDGLYFRYASALHDADTHSCQNGEGVDYSLLLGAITSIRDEEVEQLRAELAKARATIGRVKHALMNQSHLVSLDDAITTALGHEE